MDELAEIAKAAKIKDASISRSSPTGKGLRRGRKPRGRPKERSSLRNQMRINEELRNIIIINNRGGETFNDTILRMFREKMDIIRELHVQIDDLQIKLNECNLRVEETYKQAPKK
jgi:hypothetical protein